MGTSYTFELLNHPKAISIDAKIGNLLDGRHHYLDQRNRPEDSKSTIWTGFRHYSTYDRRWENHADKKALPRLLIPGQIKFETEEQWRHFQHSRDRPGSKFPISSSYKNRYPVPELNQSGYAYCPFNLYRTGVPALTLYNPHNPWPKTHIRSFPSWRGPRAYYGYYHEELDVHHNGGFRYPRDAKVLVNDEDILKYEQMRNVPTCYRKLPVEFPVLA